MPRTPSIRYYDSRQAYYTQYHGQQHCLAAGPKDEPDGPVYRAAVDRFSHIMHASDLDRLEDDSVVSAVLVRYYHSLKRGGQDSSLRFVRKMLDPGIVEFGHLKIKELKPIHVNDWVDKMRVARPGKTRVKQWNDTSCSTAIDHLNTAINWAVSEKIITKNPLDGMKRTYRPQVRGEEYVIPEELQNLLIANVNPQFGLVMRTLRASGARPGEVLNAQSHNYRAEHGAFVHPWNAMPPDFQWKNAKKTKKDRVIFLPDGLRQEVEDIVARRPNGYIFLTPRGKRWSGANVSETMRALRRKKPVAEWLAAHGHSPDKVILYGFRHSYITSWLRSGRSIKVAADLCGTSVKMIEKHYSHLYDLVSLRDFATDFSRQSPSSPPNNM